MEMLILEYNRHVLLYKNHCVTISGLLVASYGARPCSVCRFTWLGPSRSRRGLDPQARSDGAKMTAKQYYLVGSRWLSLKRRKLA